MKNFIKQLLREGLEKYDGFEFQEDYYDYNNNQHYIRCKMFKDGELVAEAQYVKYGDEISISMIQSYVKGRGYGTTLMKHLAKLYGYENLIRTSLTPDGVKMRHRLDKHFKYIPKEVNNHLPQSTLKNITHPHVKSFINDLITLGYTQTWEKHLKNPEFKKVSDRLNSELGIDFNDVSDLEDWIQGAIGNLNSPEEEPPHWVMDTIKKLETFK